MKKRIWVIPEEKERMFSIFNIIFISYGCLINDTDSVLKSGIFHELGHINNFKKLLLLIISLSILFVMTSIITPIIFCPIVFVIMYLFTCWICRISELVADQYMHKHVGYVLSFEFFDSLEDCNPVFYLLRWHPSVSKRKKQIRRLMKNY